MKYLIKGRHCLLCLQIPPGRQPIASPDARHRPTRLALPRVQTESAARPQPIGVAEFLQSRLPGEGGGGGGAYTWSRLQAGAGRSRPRDGIMSAILSATCRGPMRGEDSLRRARLPRSQKIYLHYRYIFVDLSRIKICRWNWFSWFRWFSSAISIYLPVTADLIIHNNDNNTIMIFVLGGGAKFGILSQYLSQR